MQFGSVISEQACGYNDNHGYRSVIPTRRHFLCLIHTPGCYKFSYPGNETCAYITYKSFIFKLFLKIYYHN